MSNMVQAGDGQYKEWKDKLVGVFRTTKVAAGGRTFGFTALVVVGDGKGKVGYGHGKSSEVPIAIQKAMETARRDMVQISLNGHTIHHEVKSRHGTSTILMKPAKKGSGVIAGNAMRAVFEVMGIQDIVAKCIGSSNPVNVVRATIKGLVSMTTPSQVAAKRGKLSEELIDG